jgi:transposase-like protein
MSALKGDRTISELASQFDVHPNQIVQWKKKLVENASAVFTGSVKVENSSDDSEIMNLHAKIGQLTMERDFLVKVLGPGARPSGKR